MRIDSLGVKDGSGYALMMLMLALAIGITICQLRPRRDRFTACDAIPTHQTGPGAICSSLEDLDEEEICQML